MIKDLKTLKITNKTEKDIQKEYKEKYANNATLEFRVNAGRIDVVIFEQTNIIVEIKKAYEWKYGIGQLMAYGVYLPQFKKRLHLFGWINKKQLDVCKETCKELNIELVID